MEGKHYIGTRVPMSVERFQELGWSREEAEGLTHDLAGERQRETAVLVVDRDGAAPLRHHVQHSPTGFEWGYAGSGPAELARCILIEHFDLHEEVERDRDLMLPVSHQDFKFENVATLERDGFVLSDETVGEWVALQQGKGPRGG
jgi:hypothetical protein